MAQADLEQKAYDGVMKYDIKGCKAVAEQAVAEGADLVALINNGFTKAITQVGELFAQKKIFLPHIMAAANAMNAGIEVLTPELEKSGGQAESIGTFCICTIEGDIHSIGKDICAIMLKVAGFNVINLGRDVKLDVIVQACKDNNAIAMGSSALMTSTMVGQKTLEDKMKAAGLKGKCLTNVGGAPVTQQWADEIGADVYSENSNDIVTKMVAAVKG
ncbi:trimethylamine corrinoid protein MttC [methanogenic archaeon ISO4-H5]|jgi:trimethylamine corrinoid protein|nr:trimethylamine corrinoid protein MttC [methanogenic archaeon ISO4-H5]